MGAAALAALVHAGALANGFAYDDTVLILGDPGIQQIGGLFERLMQPSWPGSFGEDVGGWRPMTTATWAVTWAVGQGSAAAFHLMAVLAHAGVTAMVVLLLARILTPLSALAGGLLFAIHPVHVEAVANIAGSAEPLAALFAVSAAWLHMGAREKYTAVRAVGVVGLFTLGVLSKEGAAVLPLLLVLLDATRIKLDRAGLGVWLRDRAGVYAGMALALAGILFLRAQIVGGVTASSPPPGASVLNDMPRLWTVLGAWPHYVRLLLFPLDLSSDYGPDVIPVAFGWTIEAMLGALVGLGAMAVALGLWRDGATPTRPESTRFVALGILWIVAALLPVANVLYLGPVLVAERTLYLPSVGVAIAGGWFLGRLIQSEARLGWVVLIVVVSGGAVRSATRVPVWRSTDSVMTALLEDHPESGRAWLALGQRLMAQGRHAEARRAFSYAIGILNSEYKESTEIASHLMAMGRPESATLLLERAWREHPEWPTAPGLLASVELNSGNFTRAEDAARAAVAVQPENGSLHHLLAESLSRQGRHAEAVEARRRAIDAGLGVRLRPWFLLVGDYLSLGDTAAARIALDSAALRVESDEEGAVVSQLRATLEDTLQSNDREPS
jgi:tetratricopeptide repeat protein